MAHIVRSRSEIARVHKQGYVFVPAAVPSKGRGKCLGTPLHARGACRFQSLGILGGIALEPVSQPDGPDNASVLVHSGNQIVADLCPPQKGRGHVPPQSQVAWPDRHAVGASSQDGASRLGAVSTAPQAQKPAIQSPACSHQDLVFDLGEHEAGPSSKWSVFQADHAAALPGTGGSVAIAPATAPATIKFLGLLLLGLSLGGFLDNVGSPFHSGTTAGIQ
mmetsp:Transcript_4566/g.13131  ORF Transcript_4566/g.13131 Transcript_4566/m.13131 type:complete len:220 (+) Transcript_4566:3677-4336(+)